MIINIQDDILRIQALGLLDKLLIDKTTKRNIMWATDAYNRCGDQYEHNAEIKSSAITGAGSDIIKTRARKAMEHQAERTKHHAEVFTPFAICNKMNNYADEMWFDQKDVFNIDGEPTALVVFPDDKDWKDYVDSRRLEITCGEAPFLVSRYDVETGSAIPIERRIGILDRKLRVVSENTYSEEEWMEWAIRAFQATYGYEFQGDSLLIARVNLLMTFEENFEYKFNRKPNKKEFEKIINIIVWNIWQMDGLTGTIPYHKMEEEKKQVNFWEQIGPQIGYTEEITGDLQPPCRIYDWRAQSSLEYVSLKNKR